MKFLFINLSIDSCTGVNHGIAYLVPIIRKRGYEVSCLNMTEAIPDSEFQAEIEKRAPDIIGFSSTSHQLKFLTRYSKVVASCSDALQIVGGVASTLDHEWILEHTSVDGACIGEGELPLDDLLTRLSEKRCVEETAGFAWKENALRSMQDSGCKIQDKERDSLGQRAGSKEEKAGAERADDSGADSRRAVPQPREDRVTQKEGSPCSVPHAPCSSLTTNNRILIQNAPPPFIENLESLDFPDYSVFDRNIVVSEQKHTFVMISRGCPFNCYYCCNRALAGAYEGQQNYFRLPSVDFAIGLVKSVVAAYPETEALDFEDDLLIANKKWFLEFAERYKAEVGLPYRCCVRVEAVNSEIVNALVDSGCKRVLLGLENGNEEFRKKFLNRLYSNDLLVEKARMLRKAGLDLFTFNIVGCPTETVEQMRDTLKLNRRANPSGGVCTFFYPYKHTRLYEIAEENGLLKSEAELADITNFSVGPGIKMPPDLEKECFQMQKEITDFLEHQRLLWRTEQLAGASPEIS